MRDSQHLNHVWKFPVNHSERKSLQQEPAGVTDAGRKTLGSIGNRSNSSFDLKCKSESRALAAFEIPCKCGFEFQTGCFMEFDLLTCHALAAMKSGF